MRRLLVLFAFVLLCLPARAEAGTVFLIDGRGWGHGVGMSQYGARGYARGGLALRADPEALLPRHEAAARPGAARARAARRGEGRGRRQLLEALQGRRRAREDAEAEARPAARRRGQAGAPALAAAVRRRRLAAQTRRNRLPRGAARPPPRHQADRREQASARPLPARRRPLGDAGRLASAGSPRPGGRRALVRPGDAEAGQALRSLRRHAQPGLRRRPGRVGDDEPRHRRHRGEGALLERPRRDDLLPLDLGRADGLDRGGVAEGGTRSVSRLRRGPLRHALEAPPLGAVPADPGAAGAEARVCLACATSSSPAGRRAGPSPSS